MKKFFISGDIAEWNDGIVQARRFMRESYDKPQAIELEINSFGGDAFLGASFHNELKSYPGKVTTIVTGIAASAASYIAVAGDEVKIFENAMVMVHNPWTVALGNAKELRKQADDLEKLQASMLKVYSERAGESDLETLLDEETYLSATEAKELGFVDEVLTDRAKKVESNLFQDKAKALNAKLAPVEQPEQESGTLTAAQAAKALEKMEALMARIAVLEAAKEKDSKQKDEQPERKTGGLLDLLTK